jgi:phosphoglycolate phosphatase-like HAD superfamily hydrolase
MKKLVLFDVDHTLVEVGTAARKAMDVAFLEFSENDDITIEDISFQGMTDKQIVVEVLKLGGFPEDEILPKVDEIIEIYLSRLESNLKSEDDLTIFPGVNELLEILESDNDVLTGLLTGNVERGARLKLSTFDLNKYFPFGAFGSDSMIRSELVPFALKRAKKFDHSDFTGKDIVIIGDSIHDVNCGKPYHAKSIAVATGSTSYDELLSHEPDYIFEDLTETERIIKAIKT